MSDQISEQARFAAREFVARWERETGETLSALVADRMRFAFEIGYLRGRTEGAKASMKMITESTKEDK